MCLRGRACAVQTSVQEQQRLLALSEELHTCKEDMKLLVQERRTMVEQKRAAETEAQRASQMLRDFAERSEQEQQQRQHLELQVCKLSVVVSHCFW